jgi:phospholipid/cholesterol/gamma-HCH transport system permease protein
MSISPIHYLVLPRIAAISIALPILVLFSMLVGWAGGALVAAFNQEIGVSFSSFFNDLRQEVHLPEVINGLLKGLTFAIIVGTVSCHQGLQTLGGPRGIGRSVTKAVVNSIVFILILDYFLTRALMYLQP